MAGLYDQVAERLRATADSVLLQVETAFNAEEAFKMMVASPVECSALVHPQSVAATPVKEAAMRVNQASRVTFSVALSLSGLAGIAQFEPAEAEIKARLRGWKPDGFSGPVQFVSQAVELWDVTESRAVVAIHFSVPLNETIEAQT